MSSSFAKSLSSIALPFLLFTAAYFLDQLFINVSIYPVYLVPILWVTSKWGLRAGIPLAALSAGLSTPMNPMLEWSKNIAYVDIFITRTITLSLLAIFYINYRRQIKSHRRQINRLKTLAPQCPDCGAVICHDGQWRSLEQLILNPDKFGVTPRHYCEGGKQPTEP